MVSPFGQELLDLLAKLEGMAAKAREEVSARAARSSQCLDTVTRASDGVRQLRRRISSARIQAVRLSHLPKAPVDNGSSKR